jgi:hypothetical protein
MHMRDNESVDIAALCEGRKKQFRGSSVMNAIMISAVGLYSEGENGAEAQTQKKQSKLKKIKLSIAIVINGYIMKRFSTLQPLFVIREVASIGRLSVSKCKVRNVPQHRFYSQTLLHIRTK